MRASKEEGDDFLALDTTEAYSTWDKIGHANSMRRNTTTWGGGEGGVGGGGESCIVENVEYPYDPALSRRLCSGSVAVCVRGLCVNIWGFMERWGAGVETHFQEIS